MGSQRCEDDTCSLCGRVRTARNAVCETCGCVVCEACLEDHGPGWWCDECYGGSFAVYTDWRTMGPRAESYVNDRRP